jgi:hypothetical protein
MSKHFSLLVVLQFFWQRWSSLLLRFFEPCFSTCHRILTGAGPVTRPLSTQDRTKQTTTNILVLGWIGAHGPSIHAAKIHALDRAATFIRYSVIIIIVI